MVPPPGADEDFWPNERLFLFRDFHIFPGGHPWDIEAVNRRVTPAVVLRIRQDGLVTRNLLPEAEERLLRWRVYKDGKLVEKGAPAAGAEWRTAHGDGNYQVCLGVEGPTGFMPVSNLLFFPLFPAGEGKLEVIPADSEGDGIPDVLKGAWTAGRSEDGEPDADADADGVPDREEAPEGTFALKEGRNSDPALARLLWLWKGWEYDLKSRPPTAPRDPQ
jgi:hypothetical protein